MLTLTWLSGMAFEADPPSGQKFTMDAYPESGGQNLGPTPVETLIGALAGCTAMDVVSILAKKRQKLTGYRVELEWERPPQGQQPRPITAIRVRHIIEGENIDPSAVAQAVQLSDEKYCTVATTLRLGTQIHTEWSIA